MHMLVRGLPHGAFLHPNDTASFTGLDQLPGSVTRQQEYKRTQQRTLFENRIGSLHARGVLQCTDHFVVLRLCMLHRAVTA
jgi:hypothetical protein